MINDLKKKFGILSFLAKQYYIPFILNRSIVLHVHHK